MLPDWLLPHEISLRPRTGAGATGDVYGSPQTAAALVEHKRRMVRTDDGTETVSETTVYVQPDAYASVPVRSLVDLPDGTTSLVLMAKRRDGGDLPVPSHWEIVLE